MTRSAAPAESFVETCRVRRSRFAPCHRRLLRGTGIPCNVPMVRRFRGDTRPRHPRPNAHFPHTRSIPGRPRLARLRRRLLPRELDPRLRIVVAADYGGSGCVAGARTLQPQKVNALPTAVEHDRAEQPTGYAVERYRLPSCTDFTHRDGFHHVAMLGSPSRDRKGSSDRSRGSSGLFSPDCEGETAGTGAAKGLLPVAEVPLQPGPMAPALGSFSPIPRRASSAPMLEERANRL